MVDKPLFLTSKEMQRQNCISIMWAVAVSMILLGQCGFDNFPNNLALSSMNAFIVLFLKGSQWDKSHLHAMNARLSKPYGRSPN